jgi:hypothetical protein
MSEISVVVSGAAGSGDSVSVNVGDQTIGGGNGAAATIQVGTVTALANTANPTVVNSGSAYAAKLDFGLPRGPTGLTGNTGPANSLTIASVVTGATASVSIGGTSPSQTLSFVLPVGPANSLSIGSVTTGATASVSISGSAPSQTLSFVLQPGPAGQSGSTNLSNLAPQPLGVAASGSSTNASRSDHVHAAPAVADVTGLQAALDAKQVTGSYAAVSHTHAASQIVDFATQAAKYGPVLTVQNRTGTVTVVAADLTAVTSITTGLAQVTSLTNMVAISATAYSAISSKSTTTLYIVTG